MAKLEFIGLGIRGKPMAGHLIKAGKTVFVYDLSQESAQRLEAQGAQPCSNCKAVAQKSDGIFYHGA